MTDKKKLELIDEMIGNYYEFCSFEDYGMNVASMRMLIGCIEAVIFTDEKEEDEAPVQKADYRTWMDVLLSENPDIIRIDCDDSKSESADDGMENGGRVVQSFTIDVSPEDARRFIDTFFGRGEDECDNCGCCDGCNDCDGCGSCHAENTEEECGDCEHCDKWEECTESAELEEKITESVEHAMDLIRRYQRINNISLG